MFYFKIGDIETTTPWEVPRKDRFIGWWNSFNKEVDLSDYKCYLVGSFAENMYGANIPTMDVDIVLRNEVKCYRSLKNILDTAMVLGFQNKIFIDIKWICENVWTEHLGLRNKCPRVSKLNSFHKIKNYKRSKKQYSGILTERLIHSPSTKIKELPYGLYEVEGYDYHTASKVRKRMRENIYNGSYMDLKNALR